MLNFGSMHLLHTIASLLLMASVLLSSTGVQISQHWCGDQLINTSLFGAAEPCSHYQSTENSSCPFHAKKVSKKKCCDQRETGIDGNDYDFEARSFSFLSAPMALVAILWDTVVSEVAEADCAFHIIRNHSPPLLGLDIFVLIQSFLL